MSATRRENATLGGGCFWCIETTLERLEGVEKVVSGYAGGHVVSPTYDQVCSGNTGHAEVVQVTYDPDTISYEELLQVFFTMHDPTTVDRQGNDVGSQYRSVIFTHDDKQRDIANQVIARLQSENVFDAPIVTEVTPLDKFYRAEAHHQDYYKRNPLQPYCTATIRPKIVKLRKEWAHKLKD